MCAFGAKIRWYVPFFGNIVQQTQIFYEFCSIYKYVMIIVYF